MHPTADKYFVAFFLLLLLVSCRGNAVKKSAVPPRIIQEAPVIEDTSTFLVRVGISRDKSFQMEAKEFSILEGEREVLRGKGGFSIKFLDGKPGRIGYFEIVSRHRDIAEAIIDMKILQESGQRVFLYAIGVRVGPIDTREYLILEGPYSSRKELEYRGITDSSRYVRLLLEKPEGRAVVVYGGRKYTLKTPFTIRYTGLLKLKRYLEYDPLHGPRKLTRIYPGYFEVWTDVDGSRLSLVNVVHLEEYITGVLPYEMRPDFPLEALKAQAILARTHAVANYNRKLNLTVFPYRLTDDVYTQVYGGYSRVNENVLRATRMTRGQVLSYGGTIVQAYFHSSCGGSLESSHVWDMNLPYYSAKADNEEGIPLDLSDELSARRFIDNPDYSAYCSGKDGRGSLKGAREVFRWKRYVNKKLLGNRLKIGKAIEIVPLERSRGGRIKRLLIVGEEGRKEIDGELNIRRVLGHPGYLKSALFYVESRGANFVIHGAGFGHGLGMCQYGAAFRALDGQKFYHILQFYVPGSRIKRIYF